MKSSISLLAAITFLTLAPAMALVAADQPSNAELRLREALRNALLAQRTAENERAALQATQAENEQKIKMLTEQAETLTKQAIADKDAADKEIATLKTKVAGQDKLIAAFKEAQDKWKASYKLAADTAKAKEAERAKLASETIVLQRRVDDLQTKNNELFKTGNEILTRYEKFGLGQALLAKEPFIGTARVQLENQVQGYQDKLLDQKSTVSK